MPLETLYNRWHFHQRMNKKVWNNLERLKRIATTSTSKQDILDAMHPWRLSMSLRFNNTFALLQLGTGIILLVAGAICFFPSPLWLLVSWLSGIALCTYALLSFEKQSDIDQVIQMLSQRVFEMQYNIEFAKFPNLNANANINAIYMMAKVRQGFNCLNEGNAGNEIQNFAATYWTIDDHVYPVWLIHYIAIDEILIKNPNGQDIRKRVESHRWGACVFDMPSLAFMVSNKVQRYPRYPVRWTTSDIQFNSKFNIAGQQELELARNLTPQRVLVMAKHLDHMRGTLMFHDEIGAFCYISEQNIFRTNPSNQPLTDISRLRGYLRTLRASHYETMQESLSQIIKEFRDTSVFNANNSNK